MALFEELEKVKLTFITVCEALLADGHIDEEDFQTILEVLDTIDEYPADRLQEKLASLTRGAIDTSCWGL